MNRTVDARGRRCPYPVLALGRLSEGAQHTGTVTVLADDPAARTDIPVWCRMRRARLVSVVEAAGGGWCFTVELGGGQPDGDP